MTKALNAQRLGAQLAVVMDDKFHEQMIIMADNNYGTGKDMQGIKSKYRQSSSTTPMDSY